MAATPPTLTPEPDEAPSDEQRSHWWGTVADVLAALVEITIAAGAALVRGVAALVAGILEAIS